MGCCSTTAWMTGLVIAAACWTQLRVMPPADRSIPVLEPSPLWAFRPEAIPDLTGQVAIVTGANVGLGLATAKLLLQNGATVIMGCRRMSSCDSARMSLTDEVPDLTKAVTQHIDLSSLKSVASFTDAVTSKFATVDMLVLNAAVFPASFSVANETGLELSFSVNHVGHFLLTTRLLQHYVETSMKVCVVSSSHHYQASQPTMTLEELRDPDLSDANRAYGFSKLANIFFAQELATRLRAAQRSGVYVNAAHPGGINTNILRDWQTVLESRFMIPASVSSAILNGIEGTFLFSPDTAALTVLYTVTSPEIEEHDIQGEYFVPIAHIGQRSSFARNETAQREMWDLTVQLLHDLDFTLPDL